MDSYQVVDEPKAKQSNYLIVNPLIILFVAIFLPFVWNPPFLGKWWMPLVWLAINGYLLGSPTLKRELVISLVGLVSMFGLFFLFLFLKSIEPFNQLESLLNYMMIFLNGTYFLIIYLVVFKQSLPYEIFSYLKEGN